MKDRYEFEDVIDTINSYNKSCLNEEINKPINNIDIKATLKVVTDMVNRGLVDENLIELIKYNYPIKYEQNYKILNNEFMSDRRKKVIERLDEEANYV